MNTLILFGPPGAGKSTLIRTLRSLDTDSYVRYLDLEDVPYKLRTAVALACPLDPNHPYILGAADVKPGTFRGRADARVRELLLFSDADTYRLRRQRRDDVQPAKAGQKEFGTPETWIKKYDAFETVDASGDVRDTARAIVARYASWLRS